MKILHTSDWHIGRMLYGRKRYSEFGAFLDWMVDTICREQVDILLVAGDVFDTSTPSNQAQTLYYRFLCRIAASSCRHVVVIAGNHDSPTFLNAPKELLRALDVHVIGAMTESLADEVLVLRHEDDRPEVIICAVPYLRDRDLRTVEVGESIEDKERKLIAGIRQHYADVVAIAEQQREILAVSVPIVAMGHLFTAGGQTAEGEGMRDLYVGTLGHVSAATFPTSIDYLALGHLHVPQKIAGSEVMRYSGSPLAMGFGEAKQMKSVCIVAFDSADTTATVSLLPVPVFQRLERVKGSWDDIERRIQALLREQVSVWLEVVYDGAEVIADLRQCLESLLVGTTIEVLRVKNTRLLERALLQMQATETLDDIDVDEVFQRCLAAHEVTEAQRHELLRAYGEALASLYADDKDSIS